MTKIQQLEQQIKSAQTAYHNGESIIDDDEYDALMYELSVEDPTNALLSIIGAEPNQEWAKITHKFPLGSLNKVNTPEEMTKWITENLEGREVLLTLKLDGLSIVLDYENGKLLTASTRGSGYIGENILTNVVKMKGLPKPPSDFAGALRGEIVLTKTDHQTHFPTYSNPRNAASGLCRRLDGEGCEHLTLMFYQVFGKEFITEEEQFKFLESSGCMVPFYKVCNAQEVNGIWKEYQDTKRAELDIEIDGLVINCLDMKFQDSLGELHLRKKGKMAFKFANQFVKTTVKSIQIQIGNSGRATPVCWVEPVNLLGSVVSKASVYNMDYVNSLGLDIGAEVLICKAGEIIPRVEKVVKSTGTIFQFPTNCPECNTALLKDGKHLMCPNTEKCPAMVRGRIANWITELNLLEFGDAIIERLVSSGKVVTVADLYKLTVDDLASLERMGKKSAKKCYDILWANVDIPLEVFLGALSISMVGQSTIKAIMATGCDTLEQFHQMTVQDFENVAGIGPTKARCLYNGLFINKQLISDLLNNGITIKKKVESKMAEQYFCLTGKMTHKREDLEKMATDKGFGIHDSVRATTTYLVISDVNSTSSKAVKARKLGTKLISENDFLKIINE